MRKILSNFVCFWESFLGVSHTEMMKIKVIWTSPNFERFYKILNEANSKRFSYLSHLESKNLPICPKDDLVFFTRILSIFQSEKTYIWMGTVCFSNVGYSHLDTVFNSRQIIRCWRGSETEKKITIFFC